MSTAALDEKTFASWLQAYGAAWEKRDPEAAAKLFTDDGLYYETPFEEPAAGRDAIVAYWADVPLLQQAIQFQYEILAVAGDRGIAHWRAEFTRTRTQRRVHLDGIFVVEMAPDGRCRIFREWWHREEEAANA